jgi:hypothetical protein
MRYMRSSCYLQEFVLVSRILTYSSADNQVKEGLVHHPRRTTATLSTLTAKGSSLAITIAISILMKQQQHDTLMHTNVPLAGACPAHTSTGSRSSQHAAQPYGTAPARPSPGST